MSAPDPIVKGKGRTLLVTITQKDENGEKFLKTELLVKVVAWKETSPYVYELCLEHSAGIDIFPKKITFRCLFHDYRAALLKKNLSFRISLPKGEDLVKK